MTNSHRGVDVGQCSQDFSHDLLTVRFGDREGPLHLFQEFWTFEVLHDHVIVVLAKVTVMDIQKLFQLSSAACSNTYGRAM